MVERGGGRDVRQKGIIGTTVIGSIGTESPKLGEWLQ